MLKPIQVFFVVLAGVAILPLSAQAQTGCVNHIPAISAFPITYSENGVTTQSTAQSGPVVVAQGSYTVSVPDPVNFVGAFGLNSATVFQSCNGAFTPVSGQWVVNPTSTDFWTYTWTVSLSAAGVLTFTESGVSNTRPLGSYGSDVVNSYHGTVNATWIFNLITGAYNFTQTDSQTVDFIRGDGVPAINSEVGSGGTSGVVPTLLPVNVQFSGTFSYCTTCIQTNPPQTGAAVVGNPGDIWNDFATNSASGMPLSDVTGAATGVTLSFSADGAYTANPAKTAFTGTPYANLMQGVLYSAGTTTITLSGLNPNQNYTLYIYTQGDKNGLNRSISISANGGPPQIATQTNADTFILDNNYVVETVAADGSGNINIKGVTLVDEGDINGFQLVPVTGTQPPVLSVERLDGRSFVGQDGYLSPDPAALSKPGTPVVGVGADGAALVLVRITSPAAGAFTVSLDDTDVACNSGRQDLQTVGTVQDATAANSLATSQVTVHTTPVTGTGANPVNQAFVWYQAPTQYIRSSPCTVADQGKGSRGLTLTVSGTDVSGNELSTDTPLIVTRPPIVLVHGLWSSAATWQATAAGDASVNMISTLQQNLFLGNNSVFPADYKQSNASYLYVNSNVVRQEIDNAVGSYLINKQIAIVRADVIAHSMGAILARIWTQHGQGICAAGNYKNGDNFCAGNVNRLITIGAPMYGSFWADLLSACQPTFLDTGCAALRAIMFAAGAPITEGAITDLSTTSAQNKDGALYGMLNTKSQPVRVHAIVGDVFPGGTAVPGINTNCPYPLTICLSQSFAAEAFPSVPLLTDTDAVVKIVSQGGHLPASAQSSSTQATFAVPHISAGLPGETSNVAIASELLRLLNEQTTAPDYAPSF
jgi:pimeloyl-ACP methyl ester carboxylesterase